MSLVENPARQELRYVAQSNALFFPPFNTLGPLPPSEKKFHYSISHEREWNFCICGKLSRVSREVVFNFPGHLPTLSRREIVPVVNEAHNSNLPLPVYTDQEFVVRKAGR